MYPKDIIQQIANKYGQVKVAFQWEGSKGKKFWQHHTYPTDSESQGLLDKDTYTDRQIMPDELVIESDLNTEPMNRSVYKRITYVLKKHFSYLVWFSGGKSYHIHLMFPELKDIKDDKDRMLMKQLIIRWVYGCTKTLSRCAQCSGVWGYIDGKPQKCALLKHKVDMQLTGKHLIRIEGAEHPKTGGQKILVAKNIKDESNTIPKKVLEVYKEIKEGNSKRSTKPLEQPTELKLCQKMLYTNKLGDGKKRAAFVLFKNFKRLYGVDKAIQLLNDWNAKHYNGDIDTSGIVFSGTDDNQAPGCNYTRDILREAGLDCPCGRGER